MAKLFFGLLIGVFIGGFTSYFFLQNALLENYGQLVSGVFSEISASAQNSGSMEALISGTIEEQKTKIDALILEKKAELDSTIRSIVSGYLQNKIREMIGGGVEVTNSEATE